MPPWRRPTRTLLVASLLLSIFGGLLYTGFTLHDTAYEPTVVHQAVEAVEHAASEVQHEIITHDTSNDPIITTPPPDYGNDDFCNAFPHPDNLAIIIKTGATELQAKLPTLLATALRCVRQPSIFSDLEQTVGGHQVHDALANVSPEAMEKNVDFDIYRMQKQYVAEGREADLPELSSISIASDDWRTANKSAAWALDKYKFLHMVEQSWELAPNREWYFFLEADTYLSWPNLFRWLKNLDPHKKLYYGNAVRIWEYPKELYFGHGGSGFLLSGAVVKDFAVTHKGIANRWDKRVRKMWFGDYVLAAALYEELRLKIKDARPSLIGENPSDITFTEDTWCSPLVTLHHFQTQQLNEMFQHETKRNGSELLYRDVCNAFLGSIPDKRINWDNYPQEPRFYLRPLRNELADESKGHSLEDPHSSYEGCEMACKANERCLQFMFMKSVQNSSQGDGYDESRCHLTRAIRIGQEKQPEVDKGGMGAGKQWSSGWMKDRIASWIEDHQSCSIGSSSWPK